MTWVVICSYSHVAGYLRNSRASWSFNPHCELEIDCCIQVKPASEAGFITSYPGNYLGCCLPLLIHFQKLFVDTGRHNLNSSSRSHISSVSFVPQSSAVHHWVIDLPPSTLLWPVTQVFLFSALTLACLPQIQGLLGPLVGPDFDQGKVFHCLPDSRVNQ